MTDKENDAVTELGAEALAEAFEFLDDLRESGETNMFGATAYVVDYLGWCRESARAATVAWMETFSGKPVEERVAAALVMGAA